MPALNPALVDDDDALARYDSRGVLRSLATAGAQVREAVRHSADAGVGRVAGGSRPRSVLVAATGGTAVVGDALAWFAGSGSPVPIDTRSHGPLPGWVGSLDLVIAVSQSGRAAGPVGLAAEAARRGAFLLTVGAPDSPLAAVCAQARGVHVDVPTTRTSSRTALWSMLTPVLLAAEALGLARVGPEVLEATADRLDRAAASFRPTSESFVNPAKILAADLAEGVPVVIGDCPLSGVAARRAVSVLARIARVPALAGELPGAASAAVALLDGPYTQSGAQAAAAAAGHLPGQGGDLLTGIFRDPYLDGPPDASLAVLMLRDASLELPPSGLGDAQIARPGADQAVGSVGAGQSREDLADAVVAVARESGIRVSEARADPGHTLERLADLTSLVDFAATYLAIGLGLDPSVSSHLSRLRERTSG
jgi:glucose/mannose-6-phosphate isomerase